MPAVAPYNYKETMMSDTVRTTYTSHVQGKPLFTAYCSTGGIWARPTLSTAPSPEFTEFMGQLGAERIYLPNPREFNARVLDPQDFECVQKRANFTLCWAPKQPADGTLLEPGEAGLYTAAGCPLVVAVCYDKMAFAHAGQRCLFDTARILGQPNPRSPSSVVGSLLEAVDPQHKNRRAAHVWVFWSIPARQLSHSLNDEVHGAFNHALAQHLTRLGYDEGGYRCCWGRIGLHVHLNLPQIIKQQAESCGVSTARIHTGTFSYLPKDLPTTRAHSDSCKNYVVGVVRH